MDQMEKTRAARWRLVLGMRGFDAPFPARIMDAYRRKIAETFVSDPDDPVVQELDQAFLDAMREAHAAQRRVSVGESIRAARDSVRRRHSLIGWLRRLIVGDDEPDLAESERQAYRDFVEQAEWEKSDEGREAMARLTRTGNPSALELEHST